MPESQLQTGACTAEIPNPLITTLQNSMQNSVNRLELWTEILNELRPETMLEVGVWKGEFAAHVLAHCDSIRRYYMVDPWRNLTDWNKPWNVSDETFEQCLRETMNATAFAKDKVTVLRGRTVEIIDQVDDESLDFAYVDGDHTLRGITVDLLATWNKVKPGRYLAGDDLAPSILQHSTLFEPSLVFPFTLYFAEAVRARVFALPYNQFLLEKPTGAGNRYEFKDLVGTYSNTSLREQLASTGFWQRARDASLEGAKRALRRLRK